MREAMQPVSKPLTTSSPAPVNSGFIQRKCACGGSSSGAGGCDSCNTHKLTVPVRSVDETKLTSNGQPRETMPPFVPRPFGHDFTRLRLASGPSSSPPSVAPNPEMDRGEFTKMTESGPVREEELPQGDDRVLFKRIEGSKSELDDPQEVKAQLGSGRPLDANVRRRMESAFGHNFSSVRVQTDSRAASLATNLNAHAFTVGNEIAFGPNEYQPGTHRGERLLAHELAHVVQQGRPSASPQNESAYRALEADADNVAERIVNAVGSGARTGSIPVPSAAPDLSAAPCVQRDDKAAPVKKKCKIKTGPTYTPSGKLKATASGGTKSAKFDQSASFETDAATGADPSCCSVRQYILWTVGPEPQTGAFTPAKDFSTNTWYEDRDPKGKRYGHRTGTHAECVSINHYEDADGTQNCPTGAIYKGQDTPQGASTRTGEWQFQLKVIDTCDGDKEVGTAASVDVQW